MFLEVKNLTKSFGETQVLQGINFGLEKGQVLSIIGSSGSGKTTLLRCINALETADGGEIYVDGNKIFDAAEHFSKGKKKKTKNIVNFGFVFQSFNLFPQYTALENITLAPSLKIREDYKKKLMTKEEMKEKLDEVQVNALSLLAKVGLSEKKRESADKQKIKYRRIENRPNDRLCRRHLFCALNDLGNCDRVSKRGILDERDDLIGHRRQDALDDLL